MIKAVNFLTWPSGRTLAAVAVAAAALFWGGDIPTGNGKSFVASAEAWVGAPATPRSFAGVARRTTRRAVAVGATAGAVAVGTAAVAATTTAATVARNCVRVVGSYGRTAVVCR
jgi:hypothetical protein